MAQFRKDTHQYLGDGKTIFEVMMLSDQYGNLVGPANPSTLTLEVACRTNSASIFGSMDWEEITR